MEHCNPDFKKAYIAATEKLVQFGKISDFPIQISRLLKAHSDIQLHSFAWAERHGVGKPLGTQAASNATATCPKRRFIR